MPAAPQRQHGASDAPSAPDAPGAPDAVTATRQGHDRRPGPVLALVGPTASGKTALALELAPRLNAEIVSADAMLVYRGMDVGTAKPTVTERARVRHHMIDLVDPDQEFSVAQFQPRARAAIADVLGRGRTPLLVGGSGLYLHAVVDDFTFPPTDPDVRARLEREAARDGLDRLYARLQTLDPAAAARIQPANIRRIVRALEVIELTGRPFSSYRAAMDTPISRYQLTILGLDPGSAQLRDRVARRVGQMVDAGLLDEVRALATRPLSRTARQALGYKELLDAFEAGTSTDAALEQVVTRTRAYARRQLAWFRRDRRIRWGRLGAGPAQVDWALEQLAGGGGLPPACADPGPRVRDRPRAPAHTGRPPHDTRWHVDFVKAHGTGNDFVVVEDLADTVEITADQVRAICDRHFGVGADGVIRIAPGRRAPFFMDYRNADGSLAEMCGNGVRVVGKYLGDRGHATNTVDLETRAGVKHLTLHRGDDGGVDRVTVDMGAPAFDRAALPMTGEGEARAVPLTALGQTVTATCLSMGNPHAVVFVDDVDTAPVTSLGPALETHPAFPNKTNVEFVQVVDGHTVRQRTWERGVGETLACGTGACAVAVAAALRGHTTTSRVTIELRGGPLELEWTPGGTVKMTGPAVEVASGTIYQHLLQASEPAAAAPVPGT